ncbi:hypothetical protein Tco_1270887 [Tanacetum coccineum]
MMVVQLGYTGESEPLYYNYLRPLTSLDEGLPPPRVRATIEDITDEPGSIAAIEYRSEKMLLLTWHDSSEPTKEPVCDFVTPRSLPQHDSSTPCKDYVIEDVIRQLPFEETKLDGEAGFNDVARSAGEHAKHGNGQEDESAPGTDDDDDADFLVDKENEIVEPDIDVHLFDTIMYVPFDNIGVTNLVQDDVLEGDNVDVIDE